MTPQALATWAVGVLQIIVIALIGWNLSETIQLGKADAAAAVINMAQENRIQALEAWRWSFPVRR